MTITKESKQAIITEYREVFSKGQALIFAEYRNLPMKVFGNLRNNVRAAGGSLHAGKNTLARFAMRELGLATPEALLSGPTIIGVCYGDISPVVKAMLDFARENGEKFSVKGAVIGNTTMGASDVKALAELPPLPIVRAQLVGVLQAPAARLIGVLSAPGRQIATVLKAYAEKQEEAPAEAPAEAAA